MHPLPPPDLMYHTPGDERIPAGVKAALRKSPRRGSTRRGQVINHRGVINHMTLLNPRAYRKAVRGDSTALSPGMYEGIITAMGFKRSKKGAPMFVVTVSMAGESAVLGTVYLAGHPGMEDIKNQRWVDPHPDWLDKSMATIMDILEANGKAVTDAGTARGAAQALLGCKVEAVMEVKSSTAGTKVELENILPRGGAATANAAGDVVEEGFTYTMESKEPAAAKPVEEKPKKKAAKPAKGKATRASTDDGDDDAVEL